MRYRLRTLLGLAMLVAITIGVWSEHYRRMDKLARLHSRQADLVAEQIQFLNSVSFNVPQEAWAEYDRQEQLHRQLAIDYRRKIWRPWLRVAEPNPPLPIEVN